MTTTARSAPGGTMLENGYQTLIAFAEDPDVSLWEKTVQPPGIENGEAIDTTTMHNSTWKTKAAQALAELTNGSITVGYDPAVLSQILALQGVNGWITVHFPDGSKYNFPGYLKNFAPAALANGTHPEATCEIVPTCQIAGTETDPVYVAPA